MNAADLRPASAFAQRYGVKMLCYGGAGSGKTPAMMTAPRPVVALAETGAGSLQNAHNIPAYDATTPERFEDFVKWVTTSHEAKAFDTICLDSGTQYAELVLRDEEKKTTHGQKAYGEMAKRVMEHVNKIYYMEEKHFYVVAREKTVDINGSMILRPSFPGQQLPVEIPHLFDVILHAERISIPGQQRPVPAFRALETFNVMARDRYAKLDEFEPQDLARIVAKSMAK